MYRDHCDGLEKPYRKKLAQVTWSSSMLKVCRESNTIGSEILWSHFTNFGNEDTWKCSVLRNKLLKLLHGQYLKSCLKWCIDGHWLIVSHSYTLMTFLSLKFSCSSRQTSSSWHRQGKKDSPCPVGLTPRCLFNFMINHNQIRQGL